MRSEIKTYINKIKAHDSSLKSIKITRGKLNGFEELVATLDQNEAMVRKIRKIKLLEITDPLNINLTVFTQLRILDLSSCNVHNLQLPNNIETIKITTNMCSKQVQELVSGLKCEVIYDSEYSDAEEYYASDEGAMDQELQQITGMFNSISLHALTANRQEQQWQQAKQDDNDDVSSGSRKKMRRMGSQGSLVGL